VLGRVDVEVDDVADRGAQIAGLAAGLRGVVVAGDALTLSICRLNTALGSVERAGQIYDLLYRDSLQTGAAVRKSVDAFARFSIAAREIGATSDLVATRETGTGDRNGGRFVNVGPYTRTRHAGSNVRQIKYRLLHLDGSRRCAERTIRAMQPWSGTEWPVDRFGASGLMSLVARATNSSPTSRASRRRLLGVTLGIGAATLLPGCAIPQRLAAVPAARSGEARVLGLPNERFRIATPEGQAELDREVVAALERRRRALGLPDGAMVPALNLLAVSGGGENGAFGAGLLNGWTAHGTRPVFDLATGVSTGALTAPFAYLGPDWDEALKDVYTAITPDRVLTRRWLTAAVFDDGLADTSPLFETISHYLDERMLVAIADAYQQGRLLLIGTADIDAQTPVIWNIGAIAGSGHPRALDTVRRILLASAAIPGAFPPVMFDVTLDGEAHQEMHVDGGTFTQAFLYPSAVTSARRAALARRQRVQPARAWIIRNGRLDSDWAMVDRRSISIAARAIASMIAASGFNDAVRLYFFAQRDNVDYNLAYIGSDFTVRLESPFEPGFMRALYAYGYDRARTGFEWAKTPPL
jgi:hypothetical protein